MSSGNAAGSSCPGENVTSCKPEKLKRRGWSPPEEAFLIDALKELVANSWRRDNGFKQGYQVRLESMIKTKFPSTNIRQNPHINSKLQIWKKQHGILNMILARSGVGFDSNGKHMIECEDDQWEQILKIEPTARSMRYKQWPLLADWDEIFGKDRATGDNVEDCGDAGDEETVEGEEEKQYEHATDVHVDLTADEEGETSACNNSSKEAVNKPSWKGKRKKRKPSDPVQIVADVISELGQATSARMDTIAQRMGYELDMDEARGDAYPSLACLPHLSKKQKFVVATKFVENYATFLLFKGMPDIESKAAYFNHLLEMN